MWRKLRHPNIVAFIGITTNPLQLVSEWMPNGILPVYLSKNESANRIALVRCLFPIFRVIDVIRSSFWMWRKDSVIFTQSVQHMET